MTHRGLHKTASLAFALLLPLAATIVQETVWNLVSPYSWFLFFPAVFFSSRIGGVAGGIGSTVVSTLLVEYMFMPPRWSFAVEEPRRLYSCALFMGMGVLFSATHEGLRKARLRAVDALEEAGRANTDLRTANLTIRRLIDAARDADRAKTRFFVNASHELRTPLALILGPVARRLAREDLSEPIRRDLEIVERNALTLRRHVADLLDAARIDAGRMTLAYSHADLAALVRLAVSQFEPLTGERRIRLEVHAPESLPAEVDVGRCRQIVVNLLSNAIRHSPEGGAIVVSLELEAAQSLLTVEDDGPGVPEAMREAVFEPYRQAGDDDLSRGGYGLGLAIVRQLARLHGGGASVEDTPRGARFRVILPLSAPPGTAIQDGPAMDGGELEGVLERTRGATHADDGPAPDTRSELPSVLVIEDDLDMGRFLGQILGERYRVEVARDGSDGLARAVLAVPDLILTDLKMPGLSGEELIEELRARPLTRDVPVVVLTARAEERLRVSMLRAGADDFLLKPFDPGELLARVDRLVAGRTRAQFELRASEARLSRFVKHLPMPLAYADRSGATSYVNDRFVELFGYTIADVPTLDAWWQSAYPD